MRTLQIGSPVRGSRAGRPIMVVLDLLGRRTAMRIVWELRESTLNFRALQNACETNPALLNTRLKELREARIVEYDDEGSGYRLTELGGKLIAAFGPLSVWANEWANEMEQN